MGAFFAKNLLFFLGRVLFLSAFFAKVHYDPYHTGKSVNFTQILEKREIESVFLFFNGSRFVK